METDGFVRPPGEATNRIQLQGLKPLATIVRPTGEIYRQFPP